MSDRPCMLNPEKWRVRKYLVPHESGWVGNTRFDSTIQILLYGIWPPQWDIEGPPLMFYPMWDMAFRAAWDRAQFAAVPPPQAQRPVNLLEDDPAYWRDYPLLRRDSNGQA